MNLLTPLNQQIGELDKQLAQRSDAESDAIRLQRIPGVGPVTALMFLAVLDGDKRFDHAHSVMCYVSLVPREFSSGEKQVRGHITKAGASRASSLLIQAAQTVMRVKEPQTEAL